MSPHVPELAVITLAAAVVNGALGYGFSSITVPLALLFISSRTLNPSLVLVEVALNGYVLWVNREAVPQIRRRMSPVVIGLVPGIALGTAAVALIRPDWLKLWTFALLLPLILLQAAGVRRRLRAEGRWGFPFGSAVGALYSLTTISGPPLALFLNNQGLAKREFRASLGFIRVAEASFTAIAYWYSGLFTRETLLLVPAIVPSLAIGVPFGAWLIRHVEAETFRRVCMSFDAWIVGFALSTLLRSLRLVDGPEAYGVLAAVAAIDTVLLFRFFLLRRTAPALAQSFSQ
ncbi:MAG TPA: sulfite exporter TauE/SafE family protein [Vicinamibacterales bacterium]|nr:sulfite exporter TauE/SafE family protein [Vicinamibacterales bacterium]